MKNIIVKTAFTTAMIFAGLISTQAQNPQVKKDRNIVMLPAEIIYPEIKMEIFPNPAGKAIQVTFKPEIGKKGFVINLYDLKGAIIFSRPWQGEKIELPNLVPGEYILTARRKNELYSQKLVIAKE